MNAKVSQITDSNAVTTCKNNSAPKSQRLEFPKINYAIAHKTKPNKQQWIKTECTELKTAGQSTKCITLPVKVKIKHPCVFQTSAHQRDLQEFTNILIKKKNKFFITERQYAKK